MHMSQKKNKSNERGSAETITTVRQCMAMRQMSENNKRSCPRLRLVNRSKDENMEAGKDKIEGNQDKINGKIGAYRQFTTLPIDKFQWEAAMPKITRLCDEAKALW